MQAFKKMSKWEQKLKVFGGAGGGGGGVMYSSKRGECPPPPSPQMKPWYGMYFCEIDVSFHVIRSRFQEIAGALEGSLSAPFTEGE